MLYKHFSAIVYRVYTYWVPKMHIKISITIIVIEHGKICKDRLYLYFTKLYLLICKRIYAKIKVFGGIHGK